MFNLSIKFLHLLDALQMDTKPLNIYIYIISVRHQFLYFICIQILGIRSKENLYITLFPDIYTSQQQVSSAVWQL
jgi:hypothetical protein